MNYKICVDGHVIVRLEVNRVMSLAERIKIIMDFVKQRHLHSSGGVTIHETGEVRA